MGEGLVQVTQLKAGLFFDVIGQVVGAYKQRQGKHVVTSLYITDYTANSQCISRERHEDHPRRPLGQKTLQVEQWNKQALDPNRVKVGSYVHLNNMRGKINREGFLEGSMWAVAGTKGDASDTTFLKSGDRNMPMEWRKALEALQKREQVYWKMHGVDSSPTSDGQQNTSADAPSTPTPTHKRPASEIAADSNDEPATKKLKEGPRTWQFVTAYSDVRKSTFEKALSVTTESMYHLRGRIVNYFPNDLKDWIVAKCPVYSCKAQFPKDALRCPEHDRVDLSYDFAFKIESCDEEDEDSNKLSLSIVVNGDAADALFFALPPTADMRDGDTKLMQERVDHLLGGLRVVKKDGKPIHSAMDGSDPFDFTVFGMNEMVDGEKKRRFAFYGMRMCER